LSVGADDFYFLLSLVNFPKAGSRNPVEMGIEMARRAIELDSACSYAAALQHYHQALASGQKIKF